MADEQTPAELAEPTFKRKTRIKLSQKQIDEINKKVNEEQERQKKDYEEVVKGFEPYDIQDLDKYFHEDLEAIKNTENIGKKINRLLYILKETYIRIGNFKLACPSLIEYGYLDGYEDIDFYLKRAESFKNKIEIEIGMLKNTVPEASDNAHKHTSEETPPVVKTSICKQDDIKIESEVSSIPDNSLLETKENWNINDLSKYLGVHLGRGWSARKINEGRYKEIPVNCWVTPPCNGKRRSYYFHPKEIITWVKSYKPPANASSEASQTSLSRKGTKKHHFLFNISLKPFKNDFITNKYLDEDNAELMVDRFSKEPKMPYDKKIKWNGEIIPLVTFIYLADRLGYFDRSLRDGFRNHITSRNEGKEKSENTAKEVQYQKLIKDNFEIPGYEDVDIDATLNRAWKGYKNKFDENNHIGVNGEIIGLRRKVCEGRGITEINIKYKMTRQEAIEYYFENKNKSMVKFKFGDDIDSKMLEIISDYYIKNKSKMS